MATTFLLHAPVGRALPAAELGSAMILTKPRAEGPPEDKSVLFPLRRYHDSISPATTPPRRRTSEVHPAHPEVAVVRSEVIDLYARRSQIVAVGGIGVSGESALRAQAVLRRPPLKFSP